MRILSLIMVVLLLLVGCTSVPHVDGYAFIDDGKYRVEIDTDYLKNVKEFKYALNSFVKELEQESYDIENSGNIGNFIVTMPGSKPVEDLPLVKHFHLARTVTAVSVPIGIIFFISIFALQFSAPGDE